MAEQRTDEQMMTRPEGGLSLAPTPERAMTAHASGTFAAGEEEERTG
jgi:hypothetical protein